MAFQWRENQYDRLMKGNQDSGQKGVGVKKLFWRDKGSRKNDIVCEERKGRM